MPEFPEETRQNFRNPQFTIVDDARLGRRPGDLLRIALREEGRYWQRAPSPEGYHLVGLPRLFDEIPAGTFPGLERSPIFVVQDQLGAPRYEAARQAWGKAIGFLLGDNPDPANATKEAVAAVESVALIVGEKAKGTMGEAINALAGEGKIRKPLDKVFHRLWGFASNESGVRHLNAELPDLSPSEATLMVNWSAAALLHLLELDRKP